MVDDQRREKESVPPTAQQVDPAAGEPTHPAEPHSEGASARLNWLRAAVLGANDGIVSVVGVAGATAQRGPIFTAGLVHRRTVR